MALQQPFKCSLVVDGNKETRKFLVDSDVATNFLYLKEKVRSIYPQLLRSEFTLYYLDEDGDKITFSTNDELQAALLGNSKQVFHILAESNSLGLNQHPGGIFRGNIHLNVLCDGCEGQVHGFRYKCLQCPDYDLCNNCEAAGMHAEHPMLRVAESLPPFLGSVMGAVHDFANAPRGCGRRQWQPFVGSSARPDGGRCGARKQSCDCEAGKGGKFCRAGRSCGTRGSASPDSERKNPLMGFFNEDFLHVVEQSMSQLVEHLGLEPFVDVKEKQDATPTPTRSTEKSTQEGTNAEDGNSTKAARAAEGGSFAAESESPVEASNGLSGATAAEQAGKTTAGSPVSGLEDWTVVMETKTNVETSAEPKDGTRPKSSAVSGKLDTSQVLHPDPVISASLGRMLSMGFSNEGGWLTQLLELKQGNIDKVLEILHPTKL